MKLFIFAHQDDEFACFALLEQCIRESEEYMVIYLTKGTMGAISPIIRNNESILVLNKIGVRRDNIHFLGETLDIDDGSLPSELGKAYDGLVSLINRYSRPSSIITLAWESGHQDHDATHILAVVLAQKFNILPSSIQFPLYRSSGKKILFYKVLSTLTQNGLVNKIKIPIRSRIRYLIYCTLYRSQRKTWVGLLPFVILDYVFSGSQKTQALNLNALDQTPTKREALYDIRGNYRVEDFAKNVSTFKNSLEINKNSKSECR